MMNEMKKMKTLTLQGIPFEVVDEAARNDIESVKDTLENLPKNEIVTPDLAQNDPTAPDYVKNRTHYEGIITTPVKALNVTWDGNTDGRTEALHNAFTEGGFSVEEGYYKVSDAVLSDAEIKSAKCITEINMGDNFAEETVSISELWGEAEVTSQVVLTPLILCVREVIEPFTETGLYFLKRRENELNATIKSLTIEAGVYTETILKKLDKKFLPEAELNFKNGRVIHLVIDPESTNTNYVYRDNADAINNLPLSNKDFISLLPMSEDNITRIPYTVVLSNRVGGMQYTAIAIDISKTGTNVQEFHILDVTNSGIPTVYYTRSSQQEDE